MKIDAPDESTNARDSLLTFHGEWTLEFEREPDKSGVRLEKSSRFHGFALFFRSNGHCKSTWHQANLQLGLCPALRGRKILARPRDAAPVSRKYGIFIACNKYRRRRSSPFATIKLALVT